jgi:hypothetical protein
MLMLYNFIKIKLKIMDNKLTKESLINVLMASNQAKVKRKSSVLSLNNILSELDPNLSESESILKVIFYYFNIYK